jgi:hypothetical protein
LPLGHRYALGFPVIGKRYIQQEFDLGNVFSLRRQQSLLHRYRPDHSPHTLLKFLHSYPGTQRLESTAREPMEFESRSILRLPNVLNVRSGAQITPEDVPHNEFMHPPVRSAYLSTVAVGPSSHTDMPSVLRSTIFCDRMDTSPV